MGKCPGRVNPRPLSNRLQLILKRNNVGFANVAALFPDGLFECDLDGCLVRFNSAGLDLFGYSDKDLERGLRVPDLFVPNDREKVEKYFQSLLNIQPQPPHLELTGLTSTGNPLPVLLHVLPLTSEGRPFGFRGTFRNIYRMKTAEELIGIIQNLGFALGLTRDLKEAMGQALKFVCQIEGIHAGCVYIVDPLTGGLKLGLTRGLLSSYSESMDFHDFASQQTRLVMIGKPIYSNHPKIDIASPPVDIGQEGVLSCQAIIPMSYNGQVIAALILYARKQTTLIASVRNTVEAIGSRMASIIARVRAVDALRESESKYRLLLETMNEGFMIVDEELTLIYANHKLCQMWGYHLDEIIGLPVSFFLDEPNKKILLDHHRRAQNGETTSYEITWAGGNGREIPTIASPRVIFDDDSHFCGYCTVLTDIPELREAGKTNRMLDDDLKLKSRKLDELSIAMKVLLKERDEYRAQIEEKILANIRHRFDPLLERMKFSGMNRQQEILFDLLESSAKDLLSSFSLKLSSASLGLSSMEIQVANLLREGRSTKEIAKILNLSPRTVDSHRLSIRKKIGIRHKAENLSDHLLSLK